MLKIELTKTAMQLTDESLLFIVKCDASVMIVSAFLNQRGHPIAFMSGTLQGKERHLFLKKAIIKARRKWSHLLILL